MPFFSLTHCKFNTVFAILLIFFFWAYFIITAYSTLICSRGNFKNYSPPSGQFFSSSHLIWPTQKVEEGGWAHGCPTPVHGQQVGVQPALTWPAQVAG